MNIADKRAIRITELIEQLEEAKAIISRYVWPPDDTVEGRQRFEQRAARFAGCMVPQFKATEGAAFPCRAQSDCSPTDLEVSQRREKMWRDECTRIVNALADISGLPRDPCPGWQPCVEKIKAMLANNRISS